MNPNTLKICLISFALLYLILPRDLIPDFFGRGLGLIDDASIAILLVYLYRRYQREFAARGAEERARGGTAGRRAGFGPGESEHALDPHRVLGIDASASSDEIRTAYRARMSEYHPDKVEHLGAELRELAHRKVLEIQKAYRQLGG